MPIKDLGKYKRPGIFIEEIDKSITELPVQDVLINLVPGFSKKGPINNPIYVDNQNDFKRIFGSLDKQMERKGSFFHRTALKMIESGPIWALNLLKTDPSRDKLQWKSISLSPSYENSGLNQSPYERFFNRQDFWVRDDESFMDLVNDPTPDNDRLLHITNMGDKTITTFIFKSRATGFDVTAEDWYGGTTKVPEYIYPKDLISDYMLTVLVIAGDWSNYNELSVDNNWAEYFSSTGLLKDKVEEFVNKSNVEILANYDVSLIPNFRDVSGRDMYIKNVINNDTDKTGLFVAYNEDELLGSDFPTGKIDSIGYSIVGDEKNSINFLSYDEQITESITYNQKYLDSSSNVFGLQRTVNSSPEPDVRTDVYTNWSTYNFEFVDTTIASPKNNAEFNVINSDAYYIINGEKITFESTGSVYAELDKLSDTDLRRIDHLYLTTDSTQINVLKGQELLSGSTAMPDFTINNEDVIHLGYVETVDTGGSVTLNYTPVTVDTSVTGFVPLSTSGDPSIQINDVSTTDEQAIEIEFVGTIGFKDLSEYDKLRYYKAFDELSEKIESGKAVIINNLDESKYHIEGNYEITDFDQTTNAKIKIYVDNATSYTSVSDLLIYYIDNEFLLGSNTWRAKTLNSKFSPSDETGIVAKESPFYQDYMNGIINSLDYFITNNDDPNSQGVTKVYIRPFLDTSGVLTVDFRGSKEESAGLIKTTQWESGYDSKLIIYSKRENWKQTVEIELPLTSTDMTKINEIRVDKNRYSEIIKGSYLEAYVDETDEDVASGEKSPRRMTRVVKTTIDPANTQYKILYTDAPIKIEDNNLSGGTDYMTTAYPSIDVYVSDYKGVTIAPFKKHPDSLPDGTETRQQDILSVIGKSANTSLSKGLINKNKISWRYLVDSFGLGLTENSKQEFMSLCGEKLNCLGFLNMPSARMFRKSNNPIFTNGDGSLNFEYVSNGGDENKNPSFLYSYGIGKGESTVGYFFPYVNDVQDGIANVVPPAPFIATTYMQKHITDVAGVNSWTVAAGLSNGSVDVSGTEMEFTADDLVQLHQMGANPIVKDINSGYYINSENTAQVQPLSSLSFIHSRELLIELENDLYDMLLRYQWKFNTPNVRAEIKYRADKICKEYLNAGALYDFKNIIDKTNNTEDVINSQMGVLDTHIEIVKAMGIIVNNISIYGVGQIRSSGFSS